MMNCLSLSRKPVEYSSRVWMKSAACPGVRFAIARISFGRRLAIAEEIRAAGLRLEFLQAGQGLAGRAEARASEAEIERIYLRCGLLQIEGLSIDGLPATADSLFESGPEELAREILAAIQQQWGLSDDERKN